MDNGDREDLVRRLFVLLTMKLEDGAGRAVEGQGTAPSTAQYREIASNLHAIGTEVIVIADAIEALLAF